MATKVLMEALSPTMTEGRVIKWLKNEGDQVKAGETIAEVETDKAVMELVSRGDGVLRKVLAPEGTTVEVGNLVAVIAGPEEDISAIAGKASAPKGEAAKEAAPKEVTPEGQRERPAAEDSPPDEAKGERKEPKTAPQPAGKAAASPPAAPPAQKQAPEPGDRIKASPLARRVAQERGVDLTVLSGSGPGGRIIKRDLEGAAVPRTTHDTPRTAGEEFRDVPLSQVRKTIARRLVQSLAPIPHFFLTSEIDMERAWDARESLNRLSEEQRVSFNDIIIKVVALALTQHPDCNAWWQDDHIRYFAPVHIGMAVAVDEGLI